MSKFIMNSLNENSTLATAMRQAGATQHSMYKQRGVVLFFALMALVVMSLAAVALIRSVDTNTLIAGNLAFKQSATASADTGVETAIKWLDANQTALLNNDSVNNGYYASPQDDAKTRFTTGSSLATGTGISAGKDSSGNTISYVVERMCVAGTVLPSTGLYKAKEKCLLGATSTSPGSQTTKEYGTAGGQLSSSGDVPMYRVTVRVTGPRNTLSFTQAFVY
ncbi:pilus assembly PilX family protein [Methylotenera mobilis]|nr:hypothetical protein [Methylotenera mobilis]